MGHGILVITYHLLTEERDDENFGAQFFDERDRRRVERRSVRRLEALGYDVTLTTRDPATQPLVADRFSE